MAPDNSGPARAQTGPECVEQLTGEVLEAEHLDPDFRAFLLGHLNEVEQALRKIKLYGPGALMRSSAG